MTPARALYWTATAAASIAATFALYDFVSFNLPRMVAEFNDGLPGLFRISPALALPVAIALALWLRATAALWLFVIHALAYRLHYVLGADPFEGQGRTLAATDPFGMPVEFVHRLDRLEALHLHRVIDNEPLTIDAENLWVDLNFHLMHFVDFMPAANWWTHRADPLLQMFERLSTLLDRADQRQAHVDVAFPTAKAAAVDEERTLFGRVSGLLPASVTLQLAKRSIRDYSEAAGHDLSYRLAWH